MQYTTNYGLKEPQYADEADIEKINENTEAIDNLIHQNRTMIAPAFDNTKAYATGDPVEYLGALYVFVADKAAGAWDASKVEPTTAAEMGGGGASALADLDDVEITSPTDGQALVYDDTDDVWKNATLPEPVDVEANPSASATANLSKLKVGSTVYGVRGLPSTSSASNGDVLTLGSGKTPTWAAPAVGGDGVTIDTSTVITSGNIAEYGALNYTATQDCFVAFCVYPKSGYTTYIKINNVTIKSFYGNFGNSDGLPYEDCIFLKTGQALYVNNNANYTGNYHVYGVQEINSAVVAQLNAMKTGFDGVVYPSPVEMVQGCDELLQTHIDDLGGTVLNKNVIDFAWESGGLSQGSGYGYNTDYRIRTKTYTFLSKGTKFSVLDGYKYKIHFFTTTSSSAYVSDTGFLETDYEMTHDYYVRFDIARVDGALIDISDGDTVVSVYTYSDKAIDVLEQMTSYSYVPSLEWEIGTLNSDGLPSGNPARCRFSKYVEVTTHSEILLSPSSTKFAVYFYDQNMTYLSGAGWITSESDVQLVSGCKYIKIIGGKTNDATLTQSDVNTIASQVSIIVSKTYDFNDFADRLNALNESMFKVMSYNVQQFTGLNANETMQEIVIEKYKPDIIGLQEFREIINGDAERSIYTNIFSEYPNHYCYTGIPNYVGIVSKNKLFGATGAKYEFQSADDPSATGYKEDRGYTKAYIYQNGKKICWLNTHVDLNKSTRYVQLGELRDIVANEPYFIITGDMNTDGLGGYTSEEWINSVKPFVDAGYHVSNFSKEWGINYTFSGSTDGASNRYALDTVITSGNIDVTAIVIDKTKLDYTDGTNLIDHYAFIAYLAIH